MLTMSSVPKAVPHAVSTYCQTVPAQAVSLGPFALATLIPLHVSSDTLLLIERAAASAQMTVRDFILDAAVDAAENELFYKPCKNLTAEQLAACEEILNSPLSENEGHQRLMAKKAPWET